MSIEYKKATMRTKNASKNDFLQGGVSAEYAEGMAKAVKQLDGVELLVTSNFSESGYMIVGYPKEVSEKIKNLTYAVEQDELFGTYFDDWDSFHEVWEKGEYDPGGVWTIDCKFFEINQEVDYL